MWTSERAFIMKVVQARRLSILRALQKTFRPICGGETLRLRKLCKDNTLFPKLSEELPSSCEVFAEASAVTNSPQPSHQVKPKLPSPTSRLLRGHRAR